MNGINIRRAIGFLQVFPIIVVLVCIIDTIFDICDVNIETILSSMFGTSLFVTSGLYLTGRRLGINKWSRVLYVTLLYAQLFVIADFIFDFNMTSVVFDEMLLLVLSTGIISSFITYIYGKYKVDR